MTMTSPAVSTPAASHHDETREADKPKRRSTAAFKFVPETLAHREKLRADAVAFCRTLDRSKPFTKNALEAMAREMLNKANEPEKFLGFGMVMLGNVFWREQFLAIPFERRMLLLPHCLKHAEGCPADYDEFGLDCERCGACSIADYKVKAEKLGYKVLVAEGSPIVLKIIVSGHIDGILGVACLNVLEKAIDKVLIAGVPSYAVPLHSGDCKNTTLDESWVWECIDKYEPAPSQKTRSFVPLMRAANRIFDEQFETITQPVRAEAPKANPNGSPADPLAPLRFTETVVMDWLQHGGKRLRPFITLAAYDALTGAVGLSKDHQDQVLEYPPAVGRVAMAIEAFHKASLIHDDIQDGDQFRYGKETLHRQYGVGPAINLGDHLIGVGYKLVSSSRKELGAEVAADVLDVFAAAHMKLCEGQGAELQWSRSGSYALTPAEAMKIYALKTSPAFEAALYAGIRMAGPVEPYAEMLTQFSRHLGVAFQILNDLGDWLGDDHNKLVAGQDAQALRPTLLWAMAWEASSPAEREEVIRIAQSSSSPHAKFEAYKRHFEKLGVFDKAHTLVEKSRARVEALADAVTPDSLRELLYFVIDTVLAEDGLPQKPAPVVVSMDLPRQPVLHQLQVNA
jgi:geranylgeranyl pyrophosphate synthase